MSNLCLYLLHISNIDKSLLKNVIPELPYLLQNKIFRYRFEKDQWHAILSDLFVRKILSQELKTSPNSIELEIDDYGKPFIKGRKRHFNISHAEELIILATDERAIGVDVEHVRPLDDLESLAKTCFSDEELQSFFNKDKEGQLDCFYELWTLKESYIKAIGKGLSCSLQSFSMRICDREVSMSNPADSLSWYFKRYTFANDYKGAVCAQHCNFPDYPTTIFIDDLLKQP